MSVEIHSRDAVIYIGGADAGWGKDCTVKVSNTVIRDYKIGSTLQSTLEYGPDAIEFTMKKGYVDGTFLGYISGHTKLSVELRPQGTGAGKPKTTISNLVLKSFNRTLTRNAIILEDITGESATMPVDGTQ
jgi:hypothetical protein